MKIFIQSFVIPFLAMSLVFLLIPDNFNKVAATFTPPTSSVAYLSSTNGTVSNTTTEGSILGTGTGTKTIPAGVNIGKAYRLTGGAVYSTPVAPGNATVRIKVGGVTVATATAAGSLLTANASNFAATFSTILVIRSTGATGTLQPSGTALFQLNQVSGTTAVLDFNNAGATVPINTTIANSIDVTLQWSNAQAGQSVSSLSAMIEELN